MVDIKVGDKVKLTAKVKKSLKLAGVTFRASWTVKEIISGFAVLDESLDRGLVESYWTKQELDMHPHLRYRRFSLEALQKA